MKLWIFNAYINRRMTMKFGKRNSVLLITFVAAAICLASVSAFAQTGGASLMIAKRGYAPGEAITVTFTAPAGLPTNAWVGIIPSSVSHGSEATNDQNDVAYKYLEGKTGGTLSFTAPTTPGSYDLRMNSSDNNGAELTYVSFTVSGGGAPSSASLNLAKYSFSPGESIAVTFRAPAGLSTSAWIGIIPSWVAHGSEATNDGNDLAYQYLSGSTSGTLYFSAPTTPGSYDFRMNSTDDSGTELASVTFTVR
jgi:hypothetical protein